MADLAVTDEGVVAVGESGRVTVVTGGWAPRQPTVTLSGPVDAAVAGAVSELRLPGALRRQGDTLRPPATVSGEGDGPLAVACDPGVVIAFQGTAELAGTATAPRLAFDGSRVVTVGVVPDQEGPMTVTVPGTPAGLARYVTVASAALRTLSPDRSHPAFRAHPPLLAVGETDVPEPIAAGRPETDLELGLPADLAHVFVGAPLAYYLGATVTVGSETPELVGEGLHETFDPLPAFQEAVATLLRRVLVFEAAIRPTDGGRDPPVPPSVRDASAGDRLKRCRQVPAEALAKPRWPLAAYVDPSPERARSLPYLLDRLSPIYLADAAPLDGNEYLQRSLDDFFRSPADAPSVDPLDPDLTAAASHAWLAEGTPIGVFTTDAAAFEHGRQSGFEGGPVTVDLVLNDPDMGDERSVADTYRAGVAAHPVEVTVHERLPSSDLARVFEARSDLVHFVGHCEVDGLVCPDGTLPAASVSSVGTRTVFLNACGSVHEGRALVRGGASAGAVTLTPVLNEQAASVGTAFARLLAAGLSVERGMQLARQGVLLGSDYVVVGDGTVSVAPTYGDPGVLVVESRDGAYDVTYRARSARGVGRRYRDPFDGERRLYGETATARLTGSELRALCGRLQLPVVLDGAVRTSEDVALEGE